MDGAAVGVCAGKGTLVGTFGVSGAALIASTSAALWDGRGGSLRLSRDTKTPEVPRTKAAEAPMASCSPLRERAGFGTGAG